MAHRGRRNFGKSMAPEGRPRNLPDFQEVLRDIGIPTGVLLTSTISSIIMEASLVVTTLFAPNTGQKA